VSDLKPPRSSGDDREILLQLLTYQRDSFIRKVSGVSDDRARVSPVDSGTSLLWLTNHMADAETTWFVRRFAQQSLDASDEEHAATMVGAVDRYRRVRERTDAIIEGASLDTPCPNFDDHDPVSLRWIVAHLLEETARHAGHADILRELIDGQTGR
jgi:hypothetical protein